MKKTICALLLSALVLSQFGCGSSKESAIVFPPTRVGSSLILSSSPVKVYTFDDAMEEAEAVARITVGSWLGETVDGSNHSYYEATVLQCFKGDLPEKFTLIQIGSSARTRKNYPLFTAGNELLVFLIKASPYPAAPKIADLTSPYYIVGSFMTFMDVAYDSDGHRYYADRYGYLGGSIPPRTILNYNNHISIGPQIRDDLAKKDPLAYESCAYPYIFAEDDLLPLLTRD